MLRLYNSLIENHFSQYNKMVFLSGPRQVGKTTVSKAITLQNHTNLYLNWDNVVHRSKIIKLVEDYHTKPKSLGEKELLILDEIHKMPDWKNYIKGFFDVHHDEVSLLLTGSAKLNIYRKGGDSLMGRYFNYTLFPLSVGEIAKKTYTKELFSKPLKIDAKEYATLFKFGGFPEPFLKQSEEFHNSWSRSRNEQLLKEDIRNIENIKAIDQLELLAYYLSHQVGSGVKYSNLSNKIKVTNNTIANWVDLLSNFYYCFTIKPWSQNIPRSLIKEPKVYLWDWSVIQDEGSRFENFIAMHLLKSVNFWNETGKGNFGLYYIRDKDQKEVDFVVTRDDKAWILIETKLSSNNSISKNLYLFKNITGAEYTFQVVHNKDYVDVSCFDYNEPIIVPAKTFLSQLV